MENFDVKNDTLENFDFSRINATAASLGGRNDFLCVSESRKRK